MRSKRSCRLEKGFGLRLGWLPEQDKYGAWAASGEIDVMEAWGSQPDKVAGTIHYGENWPNNKYTGKDYHFQTDKTHGPMDTYAVEWEPGESAGMLTATSISNTKRLVQQRLERGNEL